MTRKPMGSNIQELIDRVDKYTEKLKEIKSELKEEIENSSLYKEVYESTISASGVEVSEKDAASHAFKVALKIFKKRAGDDSGKA